MTRTNYNILIDELDKLIADYNGCLYDAHSSEDRDFYANRKKALFDIKDDIVKTFITTDLDPCYSRSADITFILERTYVCEECVEAKVVGLYHGEPDEVSTKQFANGDPTIKYDF